MRMNSYLTSGASISSGSGTTRAQLFRVGAVGDDHEFAIDEAIGPGRIGRAGQRHREGAFAGLRCSFMVIVLSVVRISSGSSGPCVIAASSRCTTASPSTFLARSRTSGWRSVRTASLRPARQCSRHGVPREFVILGMALVACAPIDQMDDVEGVAIGRRVAQQLRLLAVAQLVPAASRGAWRARGAACCISLNWSVLARVRLE